MRPIDQDIGGIALRGVTQVRVSASAVAGILVGLAMASSTIVFSEPAPVDAVMMAIIIAVPILGVGRLGPVTLINSALWLVVVALGILATGFSETLGTAVKHQFVTLFLVAGAAALAAYIAADPEPRIRIVLWCYTAACLVAAVAGIAGYFRLAPGAYELFTNYGRARGTFKDPNVFGAALAPAAVFLLWQILRGRARMMRIASALMAPILIALLLSFSRGAWFSVTVSIVILGWITLIRSRRADDFRRLRLVATVGAVSVLGLLVAVSQLEQVRSLLTQRASLDQSYDQGPEGRFGGQQKAIELLLENPMGIGTHTFRELYHHEEPHNVYLSMFLNAGWLGGLLYLVTVVLTLAVGLRLAFRSSVLQGPLLVCVAAFAGVAFEGLIIDSDHWRSFFILLGCIWGLVDGGVPTVPGDRRRDDEVATS